MSRSPREIAEQVRRMVAGEGVEFASLFAEDGAPYRHLALGVIRVRDGQIVRYDDYMDPIALARLLGRTGELAATLNAGP